MLDFSQVATHCPNETIAGRAMICARLQELSGFNSEYVVIAYKANLSEGFIKQICSDWSCACKEEKIHVGTGHSCEILEIESVQHKPQQMEACQWPAFWHSAAEGTRDNWHQNRPNHGPKITGENQSQYLDVRCMYDFRQNSQTRSPMLVNSKIQLSWMMMYKSKIYTFYCELIILTFPKCHTTLRQALAICLPPRIVLSINWGGQLRTACVATALEQLHVSSWSKHFLGRRTQIWVCVLYNHIFVHLWFAMFSFPSIIYIPSPP